jgi:hypothetical protein
VKIQMVAVPDLLQFLVQIESLANSTTLLVPAAQALSVLYPIL